MDLSRFLASLVLICPLSAQGLYLNADKPGSQVCPKMVIEIDPTVGRRELNDANSGISRNYQTIHQLFPLGSRKDVSSFAAYDAHKKGTSVASLKGKLVVVAFWGYNCDPAARMLMELAQLYPRREKFGFEILAVNFDANRITEDSRALGGWAAIENFKTRNKAFLDEYPIPFYVPGLAKEGASNFINEVTSLPLLAVVDRTGHLASLDMGYEPKLVAMRLSQILKEEQAAKAAAH